MSAMTTAPTCEWEMTAGLCGRPAKFRISPYLKCNPDAEYPACGIHARTAAGQNFGVVEPLEDADV